MKKKACSIIIFLGLISGMATGQGLRLSDKPLAASDSTKVLPKAIVRKAEPLSSVKYNYYKSLGAACKVELKLEQATKVPFRFRLGSLQQTDYLEQKPNAQKPQQ